MLKKDFPKTSDKYIAMLDYYFHVGNRQKEFQYQKIYLDKYSDNSEELNSAAWKIFETVSIKETDKFKAALNWVNKSVAIDKNFYNTDTKANILYALGKYDEALKTAEESIKIEKGIGENTHETEVLLQK